MFYALLKSYARFAHRIFFRRIRVNRHEVLHRPGPMLFAANHPNSFLDGVILTTLFDGTVYSLARGDAFKAPPAGRWLRRLRLLPVYREREGVENLEHNYTTFAECLEAFRRGESVLIFSEGLCENEWHLRPLKKGTARLAFAAWQQGIPLTVIPTGFNYSSFQRVGKEVHLHFGSPIEAGVFDLAQSDGRNNRQFNESLEKELRQLVYEIPRGDAARLRDHFSLQRDPLLLIPGALGWLLHAPLLLLAQRFARNFRQTGHYDSVVAGVLLLGWPAYLLLLALLSLLLSPWAPAVTLLITPLLAWCAVQAFGR